MSESSSERHEAGLRILEALGWGHNEDVRELDEDLWQITTESNFGTLWSRPGLSLRDRELVCISVLIALGARGVAKHFRFAHKIGVTNEELKEIILQVMPYAGLPRALAAMALFKRVVQGETIDL
jgi:4-carboxymuconolactone decarboxylase